MFTKNLSIFLAIFLFMSLSSFIWEYFKLTRLSAILKLSTFVTIIKMTGLQNKHFFYLVNYYLCLLSVSEALGLTIGIVMFFHSFTNGIHFFEIDSAFNLSLFIPLKLQLLLQKYSNFKQNVYDKITIFFLKNRFLSTLIIFYHKFLFYFRYFSVKIGEKIEGFISLNMLALIVSIICSRLHVAGYLIIFILLFIRFDMSVVYMCRFYKKNPTLLDKHILAPNINKRGMFKAVGKIVEEAANNPHVQAIAVAAAGAVAWKALDVWDTHKAADIAAEDRELARENSKADREQAERHHRAEIERSNADREQAERHHRAEIERSNADREQAERHHRDEMAMRERELTSEKKKEEEA